MLAFIRESGSRRCATPAIVLSALWLACAPLGAVGAIPADSAGPMLAVASNPASAPALALRPDPARIAYKDDNGPGFGALLLRAAGGLALMTALAFGAAYVAKRYLPGVRGYSKDGQSRIQLLESRRLTPRLTLFVVEYEGKRLLLAQSGDRVVELGTAHHA